MTNFERYREILQDGQDKLPEKWWRFRHLKRAGYVNNRETLRRWQRDIGFPQGVSFGPNSVMYDRAAVEAWAKARAKKAAS